jgi:hypothetical protein
MRISLDVLRCPAMLLAFAWLVCGSAASHGFDGGMTLEHLLELVRQNELLYGDIDVTITDHYETDEMPDAPQVATFGGGTLKTIQKEVSRHRYVAQGEWYHCERIGTWIYAREDQMEVIHLRQYDGELTRGRTGGVANLIHGYKECELPIRAHTLFQRMVGISEPLSVFLRGNVGLGHEPSTYSRWFPEYKGERDCNGEPCYEVELTMRTIDRTQAEPRVALRELFWLSKIRNLIPVRAVVYNHEGATPVFSAEATVKSWLEVEPGVWFPAKAEFRAFDRFVADKQVLKWRRIYTLESISLKPDHPKSFFQSVIFPEGTLVYEFKDNKELRSYRVGSPNDPHLATGKAKAANRRLLSALGIIAIVVSMVLVVFLRYRRKERT